MEGSMKTTNVSDLNRVGALSRGFGELGGRLVKDYRSRGIEGDGRLTLKCQVRVLQAWRAPKRKPTPGGRFAEAETLQAPGVPLCSSTPNPTYT